MRTILCLCLALCVAAVAGCGNDYSFDDSFIWGEGAASSMPVHPTGIIGSGTEKWVSGEYCAWGTDDFFFQNPSDACVDANGNIYVADMQNHRVCKWSADGTFTGFIGAGADGWYAGTAPSAGSTDDHCFNEPSGVFVAQNGDIYVSDYNNHRISKWNSGGAFLGWIGEGLSGWQTGASQVNGSGLGWLNHPRGLFVDQWGQIFVCDSWNHRICLWDSAGNPLGWIGCGTQGWQNGSGSASGSDWDRFNNPSGIWVDKVGEIYVADTNNHRISRWDSDGYPLGWFGHDTDGWRTDSEIPHSGNSNRLFNYPRGVFVDWQGRIYIADADNQRIVRWGRDACFQGWIGYGYTDWRTDFFDGHGWSNSSGFSSPYSVFLDNQGYIFVADRDNHRISRWKDPQWPVKTGPDGEAPTPIIDLAVSPGMNNGEIELTWRAPFEDNGTGGRAYAYIFKFSSAPMNDDGAFQAAPRIHQGILPQEPGSLSSTMVGGLPIDTTYWFRMKSVDEEGNQSAMSNEAFCMPTGSSSDTTAPAAISLSALTGTGTGEVDLTWTAVGDDDVAGGPATGYVLKYSTSPINNDTDFANATLYVQTWGPLASTSVENQTITLPLANTTYYLAIKAFDEVPNFGVLPAPTCTMVMSGPGA